MKLYYLYLVSFAQHFIPACETDRRGDRCERHVFLSLLGSSRVMKHHHYSPILFSMDIALLPMSFFRVCLHGWDVANGYLCGVVALITFP